MIINSETYAIRRLIAKILRILARVTGSSEQSDATDIINAKRKMNPEKSSSTTNMNFALMLCHVMKPSRLEEGRVCIGISTDIFVPQFHSPAFILEPNNRSGNHSV